MAKQFSPSKKSLCGRMLLAMKSVIFATLKYDQLKIYCPFFPNFRSCTADNPTIANATLAKGKSYIMYKRFIHYNQIFALSSLSGTEQGRIIFDIQFGGELLFFN